MTCPRRTLGIELQLAMSLNCLFDLHEATWQLRVASPTVRAQRLRYGLHATDTLTISYVESMSLANHFC